MFLRVNDKKKKEKERRVAHDTESKATMQRHAISGPNVTIKIDHFDQNMAVKGGSSFSATAMAWFT